MEAFLNRIVAFENVTFTKKYGRQWLERCWCAKEREKMLVTDMPCQAWACVMIIGVVVFYCISSNTSRPRLEPGDWLYHRVNRARSANCTLGMACAPLPPCVACTMATGGIKRASKVYNVTFKLKAVDLGRKNLKRLLQDSLVSTTRLLKNVSKRVACRTKRQQQVEEVVVGRSRKKSASFWDGEALFSWIMELHSRNLCMSQRMIRVQARTMSSIPNFTASRGWLERIIKRYFLSLHRKTTVCQRAPADCIPKLVSFVTHPRWMQKQHKYTLENMFATDETACWMGILLRLLLPLL